MDFTEWEQTQTDTAVKAVRGKLVIKEERPDFFFSGERRAAVFIDDGRFWNDGSPRLEQVCTVSNCQRSLGTGRGELFVDKSEVNWSAWGSQGAPTAALFAEALGVGAVLAEAFDNEFTFH